MSNGLAFLLACEPGHGTWWLARVVLQISLAYNQYTALYTSCRGVNPPYKVGMGVWPPGPLHCPPMYQHMRSPGGQTPMPTL